MTANSQVDTDEMRIAGLRATLRGTGEGPLWNAAADEIDRLRDRAIDDAIEREQIGIDFNAHAAERDRLRRLIEDAPHPKSCAVFSGAYGYPCTCWKATAL